MYTTPMTLREKRLWKMDISPLNSRAPTANKLKELKEPASQANASIDPIAY